MLGPVLKPGLVAGLAQLRCVYLLVVCHLAGWLGFGETVGCFGEFLGCEWFFGWSAGGFAVEAEDTAV